MRRRTLGRGEGVFWQRFLVAAICGVCWCEVSLASCPTCSRYVEVLGEMGGWAHVAYRAVEQGPMPEMASDSTVLLLERQKKVCDDLDEILCCMEGALHYSLSSVLPCKMELTCFSQAEISLLQRWQKLAEDVKTCLQTVTHSEPEEGVTPASVSEAIRACCPDQGFSLRLVTAFQKVCADGGQFELKKDWLTFWSSYCTKLTFFFQVLAFIEERMNGKPKKLLCRSCWEDSGRGDIPKLSIRLSKEFQTIQRNAYLALKELHHFRLISWATVLQNHCQKTVTTLDAHPVAFIEGIDTPFVQQSDGSFRFAVRKKKWNAQSKKTEEVVVWEPLTIDPSTGLVCSPVAFRGLSAPRLAYVRWTDYVAAVRNHLAPTEPLLRRLLWEAGEKEGGSQAANTPPLEEIP